RVNIARHRGHGRPAFGTRRTPRTPPLLPEVRGAVHLRRRGRHSRLRPLRLAAPPERPRPRRDLLRRRPAPLARSGAGDGHPLPDRGPAVRDPGHEPRGGREPAARALGADAARGLREGPAPRGPTPRGAPRVRSLLALDRLDRPGPVGPALERA